MIIEFKDRNMFLEWSRGQAQGQLVSLVYTLAEVWPAGKPMRFTSFNRSKLADKKLGASGIHSAGPPHRALDVGAVEFDQLHIDAMAEYVNTHWVYDRNRPHLKCAISKPHGTGKHLHLQVHKRTERRIDDVGPTE